MPNPAARKPPPVTLHQTPRHWINFTTKSANMNWHSPTSASCWFAAPLEEGGDFFSNLIFDWGMRETWLPWLIFKFGTLLFFNVKEASKGWVGHNHRLSTQWIIIYRLVVFLTPLSSPVFGTGQSYSIWGSEWKFLQLWQVERLETWQYWNNMEHLEAFLMC